MSEKIYCKLKLIDIEEIGEERKHITISDDAISSFVGDGTYYYPLHIPLDNL